MGGMTPQSSFMVLHPIAARRLARLRELLADHESFGPGVADPDNRAGPVRAIRPAAFRANSCILDDPTLGDITAYGLSRSTIRLISRFWAISTVTSMTFMSDLAKAPAAVCGRCSRYCEDFRPTRICLPG